MQLLGLSFHFYDSLLKMMETCLGMRREEEQCTLYYMHITMYFPKKKKLTLYFVIRELYPKKVYLTFA